MKAGARWLFALAAIAALGASSAGAAAADGGAGAMSKKADCKLTVDEGESLGASYVTPLAVKNTSCGKGMKVVKAFNQCRKANGGADGRCKSKVLGYKCEEGKRTSSPAQYSADVVCKNGSKKVVFSYTQNT